MSDFVRPEIYDHYKRPEKVFEEGGGERLTERAGYIPAHIQIQQFINAGRRLNEARANEYDWGNPKDVDMSLEDPTRSPNFDLADASELAAIAAENLAASAANQPVEAVETEKAPEVPEA